MTTVHRAVAGAALPGGEGQVVTGWSHVSFTKGSVDGMLALSAHIWAGGQAAPLTPEWRQRIQTANDRLAAKGMRVLGVALRPLAQAPANDELERLESELTFVGLFGMIDPPRKEVKDAVATSRTAGIRPIMITGDHPLTALHIARELGIAQNDRVLTGPDLERLSIEELKAAVDEVSVFARVSPEHKLKIVQALQEKGQIVAMTGDGVNDAPALKRADIGVAMGITGTDVAKEAADMVLLDDNFATIVAAVEQGRVIYDNIRKFVKFSVAGNLGKVLVMLLAPFLGKPLPLLPLQLLWLNLLTDGLLGLGLGVEPAERGTMRRKPYAPGESIFSRGAGAHVIGIGVLIGALGLAVGAWYYYSGRETWQTMVFTTLAFAQMWQALGARSTRDSLFTLGLLSNPTLLAMLGVTFALQLAVIYLPFMQAVFNTTPLLLTDLGIALALGSIVFIAIEVEKWLARRREHDTIPT
jgi:Ca2+-transporting ATPase